MGPSYRKQMCVAIARVLPVDDFRDVDRRTRCRWGWYPLAMVWLLQILSRGVSLAERFEESRRWLRGLAPTLRLAGTYQGFVKALRRRGELLTLWIHAAFQERIRQWCGDADLVAGFRPLAVDGTRFDCPRSRSCQRRFRLAGRDKSPPQLTLTSLWHLGVHCWWDGRIGPATTSERTMLRDMLDDLPPHTLLVGDAGFIGFDLCSDLCRRQIAFLLRVGANVDLLTQLGWAQPERRDTVYLWPAKCGSQPPVCLRLIVIGTGRRRVYVVTNVLDPATLSRRQAADFYRRRWGVETAYRAVKQTLERRRLHSHSSDLAIWELIGVFFGGWALSLISLSTRRRQRMRHAWSPARITTTLRHALHHLHSHGHSLRRRLANALLPLWRRRRRKTRQDWPHKKHEPLCGAPNLHQASLSFILRAQHLKAMSA
jgi:Transposase DDE domain